MAEVRLDELIPPAGRCFHDGRPPGFGLGDDPPLVLGGDVGQDGFAHRIQLPVRVEEPDDPLRLLERLNQPVEQDAIETPIRETDAIVVMLLADVCRAWR